MTKFGIRMFSMPKIGKHTFAFENSIRNYAKRWPNCECGAINWEFRKAVYVGRNKKYLLPGSIQWTIERISLYTQRNKLTGNTREMI